MDLGASEFTIARAAWTSPTPHRTADGQAGEDREPLADRVVDTAAGLGAEDTGGIEGPEHRRRPRWRWGSWGSRENAVAWPLRPLGGACDGRLLLACGAFQPCALLRSRPCLLASGVRPHQAEPVLAHEEPGEDGAVEEIKSEGGALEAEDAGGDPDHESARLHRRGSRGSQRVPMPQDMLQPLKS